MLAYTRGSQTFLAKGTFTKSKPPPRISDFIDWNDICIITCIIYIFVFEVCLHCPAPRGTKSLDRTDHKCCVHEHAWCCKVHLMTQLEKAFSPVYFTPTPSQCSTKHGSSLPPLFSRTRVCYIFAWMRAGVKSMWNGWWKRHSWQSKLQKKLKALNFYTSCNGARDFIYAPTTLWGRQLHYLYYSF